MKYIFLYTFLFVISISNRTIASIDRNNSDQLFSQTCKIINEDDYVRFEIELSKNLHNISDSTFVFSVTAYEDENCRLPYLIIRRTFRVESYINSDLNLNTELITYTSLSDEVTRALNLSKYCGLKNWKTKIPQDVSGLKCDDYLQLSKNQKYFQILKIDADSVLFGQENSEKNGRSEQNRPDKFDEIPFNLIN